MTDSSSSEASASRPVNNVITASVPADWAPGPDAEKPTPFAEAVDRVLHLTAEIARNLVGAHQGAATLLVSGDWKLTRHGEDLGPRRQTIRPCVAGWPSL